MEVSRSQGVLPIRFPPARVIVDFAGRLAEPQTILDAGAHTGRHSLYLAERGHTVVGVDQDHIALQSGILAAQELGAIAGKCLWVCGDVRSLMFARQFDAIVANEVLHFMSKPESRTVLDILRERTRPGGLHAVSGYLVEPNTANHINNARCLQPGELYGSYTAAGWQVLQYHEDYQPIQYIGRNKAEQIFSRASIIAKAPK